MTFHKYPKIKRLGERDTKALLDNEDDIIYEEEKLDGAQFRFMPTEDGRIVFGSRNQSIGDSTNEINGNWKNCVDYIINILKDKDISKYAGYIFYGECCIPHSIQYDWDNISPFIAYDVMKDDVFLSYDEKCEIFNELGFEIIKLLDKKFVKDINILDITDNDVPKSEYGAVQAEGIVFKNYRTQVFAKYVCKKFKEVNKSKFGESKKYCKTDNELLIATYCTNARIDKYIFKLMDEGNELDMKLMQYLPKVIWNDIVEECSVEILNENWIIDFRQVRKDVAKRCVAVLEQMISLNYVQNRRNVNVETSEE